MSTTPLFVAVGHDGARLVSTDGRAWGRLATGKEGEVYRAAAFGNGRCVAVGTYGGNNILGSTVDGTKWDVGSKDGKYSLYVRGLTFGKGQFVAFGGDPGSVGVASAFVLLSPDGVAWSDYVKIAGKFIIRRVAWGNDLFVGVGDRGRRSWSADAREWTDVPGTKAVDTLIDVAFGGKAAGDPNAPPADQPAAGGTGGLFVGVGLHGLRLTSRDGKTWSERLVGLEGEHLNSIVWADDRFVAVGAGATYVSADGAKWDRHANQNAPTAVTYGNGVFVGTAWRGQILVSKDGVDWKLANQAEQPIEAVGFGTVSAAAVP